MSITIHPQLAKAKGAERETLRLEGMKKLAHLLPPGVEKGIQVVQVIAQYVEEVRQAPLPDVVLRRTAIEVGIAWAYQVNQTKKARERWVWFLLAWDGGPQHLAFAPLNGTHAVLPGDWLYHLFTQPEAENNVVLLYNLLLAGNLPPSEPKKFTILT